MLNPNGICPNQTAFWVSKSLNNALHAPFGRTKNAWRREAPPAAGNAANACHSFRVVSSFVLGLGTSRQAGTGKREGLPGFWGFAKLCGILRDSWIPAWGRSPFRPEAGMIPPQGSAPPQARSLLPWRGAPPWGRDPFLPRGGRDSAPSREARWGAGRRDLPCRPGPGAGRRAARPPPAARSPADPARGPGFRPAVGIIPTRGRNNSDPRSDWARRGNRGSEAMYNSGSLMTKSGTI